MHHHRDNHGFRDNVAAMLADVGLHFLAALRVGGLAHGLGLRQFQGVHSAFLAGLVFLVMNALTPHHDFMAVEAPIRRELENLQPLFQGMFFGQGKISIFSQFRMAYRTLGINTLIHTIP